MNFANVYLFIHFRVVRSGSKISCLAFLCPSTVLFRLYLFDTLWIILFYAGSKQSFSLTYDFAMLRIVRICRCAPSRASSEVSPRNLPALRAAKSVSWIFRVALLFICQGAVRYSRLLLFTFQVSSENILSQPLTLCQQLFISFSVVVRCFPQQRIWVYHPYWGLSTNFQTFF